MPMRITLIGHPVAHSRSPAMQNAAFAAAGLDWRYELWDTPLEDVPARIRLIREDSGIGGANVTIPHKQNVAPLLDEISPHAQAIGAVNTIVKRPGGAGARLAGDNTDWIGFLNDLAFHGVDAAAKRALVLGAGGSARAIVYALAQRGAGIVIVNRDQARAESLAADMRRLFPGASITAGALAAGELQRAAPGAQLVVNCTSAGMSPNDDTLPWFEGVPFPPAAVLYDLVYKPRLTRLMRCAEAAGARAIGGIGMLAEQGAAAFDKWTAGRSLPVTMRQIAAIMRATLEYP